MSCTNMKMKFAGELNDSVSKKAKTNSILEQDFVNYISVPSLENMAIAILAIELCKQTDIRDAIPQLTREYGRCGEHFYACKGASPKNSFDEIEKRAIKKLSFVALPELLKAKVINIIAPVLLQMDEWIRCGDDYSVPRYKKVELMDSVCWTNEGTIDKVKSFEKHIHEILSDERIARLYEAACNYCLEKTITVLWHKLPKNVQENYSKNLRKSYYRLHLAAYWTSKFKNELSELLPIIMKDDCRNMYNSNDSVYKNLFALGILEGNISAVKYFWYKLTLGEISSYLTQWIDDSVSNICKIWNQSGKRYQDVNKYSNILFFLLSQVNDAEQQKEILRKHCKVILSSLFIHWPWQRYLLPTIQAIGFSLSEDDFVQLLSTIGDQIKKNKTTEKVLRKLWIECPINLKKCFVDYVINDCESGTDALCNLLLVEDIQSVKLILNYANDEEKKQIMFSIVKNSIFCEVICSDRLSLFDTLLDETLMSVSDVQNIKSKFIQDYGNELCCDWIYDDNFLMVEKLFNWAFTSQDEIQDFKNEILNKIEVTYNILKHRGNYELVDKFLNWCYRSDQEIEYFKKNLAKTKCEIVCIGENEWNEFEKFSHWCSLSDEDIDMFKFNILQSTKISDIIFDRIINGSNFEFIDKLITWCCHSNEEIKQFKAKFVFSSTWMNILQRIVSNEDVTEGGYNNWQLIHKLIELFAPLDEEVTINLKEKISTEIDFYDFHNDDESISCPIEEEELLDIIDCYNECRDSGNECRDSD